MSSGPETETRRSMSSEPEVAYRPISQMAVISFVLAILSALAFAWPYFWVIPVIALAVSVLTSRKLEKARREYAGQVLAKAAVAISLGCMVAAPTQYFLTRAIITREARSELGDRYLDLILANRPKEAFVLTLPPPNRAGNEDNPDELIVRAGDRFRTFLNGETWVNLGARLAEAQVTYNGVEGYGFAEGYYVVALSYRIEMDDVNYDVLVVAKGGEAMRGEWAGRKWYVEGARVSRIYDE